MTYDAVRVKATRNHVVMNEMLRLDNHRRYWQEAIGNLSNDTSPVLYRFFTNKLIKVEMAFHYLGDPISLKNETDTLDERLREWKFEAELDND